MNLHVPKGIVVPTTELNSRQLDEIARVAATHINHEAATMNKVTPEDLMSDLGWFVLAGENMVLGHVRLIESGGSALRLSSLWVASEARGEGYGHALTNVAVEAGISEGMGVHTVTRTPEGVEFFKGHGFGHDASASPAGKYLMVHAAAAALAVGEQVA